MVKNLFKSSIENAFYFSFAAFVVIWIAGFLYELFEKSPDRLNLGVVILLVLGLILVLFLLAITNILFFDEAEHGFFVRLSAVFLFALLSTIIILILIALFWYPL